MNKRNFIYLLLSFAVISVVAALVYVFVLPKATLGLDLKGGAHIMLEATPATEGGKVTNEDMIKVKEVMNNRVNALGTKEPVIQSVGDNRVSIDIAGISDVNEAVNLIGSTQKLEFIEPVIDPANPTSIDLANGKVVVDGSNIKYASSTINSVTGKPEVSVEFDDAGTKAFAEATKRLAPTNGIIYITLDGQPISNPSVNEEITSGKAAISMGDGGKESADSLASSIKAGALPVQLNMIEKSTVGASLGKDSLKDSKFAIFFGLILLSIFLVLVYRLPGVITVFSLVAFSSILMGVLIFMGTTFTLPGIAAIILTIGIAADANIIMISRFQDELRKGRSYKGAFQRGFDKSKLTIIDANVTSMIASIVLYFIATGSIKGFALIIIIGILINLITALVLSKHMMNFAIKSSNLQNPWFYSTFKKIRKEIQNG